MSASTAVQLRHHIAPRKMFSKILGHIVVFTVGLFFLVPTLWTVSYTHLTLPTN